MKKLQTFIVAIVFISAYSFSFAVMVGAQGNAGVGMNSTIGMETTGYNSLSTSGAYGTSVVSGTGNRAVGNSNDTSMMSGYLNGRSSSNANGLYNLSYNDNSNNTFALRTNDIGDNASSTSDWGWLGLIGLLGLIGSRGRVKDR